MLKNIKNDYVRNNIEALLSVVKMSNNSESKIKEINKSLNKRIEFACEEKSRELKEIRDVFNVEVRLI